MKLPDNKILDINKLSQIFETKTTAYKYYWFMGLLDILLNEKKTKISFWEIIATMISNSWYPIHYFKISFGKSDSLFEKSTEIQRDLQIPIDADKDKIKRQLLDNLDETIKYLRVFAKNVPFRLLKPWIRYTNDDDVVEKSQKYENDCIYAIKDEYIIINDNWKDYLIENYEVLLDFTLWNLMDFLQKRNPNVPNLSSKLIKPPLKRKDITKQRKLWDGYIESVGAIKCIYTGKEIVAFQDKTGKKKFVVRSGAVGKECSNKYDLDHFMPWSFVSHDLLWNLLPSDSSINSSKSNKLPPLDRYLRPFASLQYKALQFWYSQDPSNDLLEDYLSIYDSISELVKIGEPRFCEVLSHQFSPMKQIAENMGFETWER